MTLLAGLALARTVSFAGHEWQIKTGTQDPGPNLWSDATESVWVDDMGALHLALRETDGVWTAAEVFLEEARGFGTYRAYVDTKFDEADPAVVVGFFAEDEATGIAVEFTRWGDPTSDSVWHTVQPPAADTRRSFDPSLGGSFTTHLFEWEDGSVHFQSLHGHFASPPDSSYVIGDWTCTAGVPGPAARMSVHLGVWLLDGEPPADGEEVEVVVWDVDLPDPPQDTGTPGGEDSELTTPDKPCSCGSPGALPGLVLPLVGWRRRRGAR